MVRSHQRSAGRDAGAAMNQFARTGTKQSKTGWARKLATAAALAVALPVILGPPADALGGYSVTGRPATVLVWLPMIGASEGDAADGYPPVFITNGMRTGRSPASTRWQKVTVIYALQRYSNGAWHNIASSRRNPGYVHGTSKVTFSRASLRIPQPAAPRAYRFVYIVRWEVNATGRRLGSVIIYPNRSDETACYTQERPCNAYFNRVVT
jgi:hypothetical protein